MMCHGSNGACPGAEISHGKLAGEYGAQFTRLMNAASAGGGETVTMTTTGTAETRTGTATETGKETTETGTGTGKATGTGTGTGTESMIAAMEMAGKGSVFIQLMQFAVFSMWALMKAAADAMGSAHKSSSASAEGGQSARTVASAVPAVGTCLGRQPSQIVITAASANGHPCACL